LQEQRKGRKYHKCVGKSSSEELDSKENKKELQMETKAKTKIEECNHSRTQVPFIVKVKLDV